MEELVRYIVTSLVDFPEEISVTEIEGEEQTVLELRVSPKDVGKVIGKNGRIAKSLRAILTAASIKAGKNISLEIID
ncbi:KH domain protein [Leptospira broomii serovar Hurstbridge str. 5399]|uniref:RNA-binding protein KhpA n=3 Tax=Leptospira TaxID=171 RepID=V6HD84_9LEPT|nr:MULTISPECIES: KH domain-containing protein [Leptospira]EQA38026.1 KH domain protein [Leptospira inadai serovar Lyme str. 10]EQA43633.1 KH domain protein [Leptospira broomii serovar Hurstbridge str. 5399]PNV76298.1 KH domain-containing protein [Leptospira inadai serovar Lyme]